MTICDRCKQPGNDPVPVVVDCKAADTKVSFAEERFDVCAACLACLQNELRGFIINFKNPPLMDGVVWRQEMTILNLREKHIRDALISLGWTPPPQK